MNAAGFEEGGCTNEPNGAAEPGTHNVRGAERGQVRLIAPETVERGRGAAGHASGRAGPRSLEEAVGHAGRGRMRHRESREAAPPPEAEAKQTGDEENQCSHGTHRIGNGQAGRGASGPTSARSHGIPGRGIPMQTLAGSKGGGFWI